MEYAYIQIVFVYMHFMHWLKRALHLGYAVHVCSVNRTRDCGVASAMLYCLSYCTFSKPQKAFGLLIYT